MTDTPTAPDDVRDAARDVYERTECASGCCGDVDGAIDVAYAAGLAQALDRITKEVIGVAAATADDGERIAFGRVRAALASGNGETT